MYSDRRSINGTQNYILSSKQMISKLFYFYRTYLILLFFNQKLPLLQIVTTIMSFTHNNNILNSRYVLTIFGVSYKLKLLIESFPIFKMVGYQLSINTLLILLTVSFVNLYLMKHIYIYISLNIKKNWCYINISKCPLYKLKIVCRT